MSIVIEFDRPISIERPSKQSIQTSPPIKNLLQHCCLKYAVSKAANAPHSTVLSFFRVSKRSSPLKKKNQKKKKKPSFHSFFHKVNQTLSLKRCLSIRYEKTKEKERKRSRNRGVVRPHRTRACMFMETVLSLLRL